MKTSFSFSTELANLTSTLSDFNARVEKLGAVKDEIRSLEREVEGGLSTTSIGSSDRPTSGIAFIDSIIRLVSHYTSLPGTILRLTAAKRNSEEQELAIPKALSLVTGALTSLESKYQDSCISSSPRRIGIALALSAFPSSQNALGSHFHRALLSLSLQQNGGLLGEVFRAQNSYLARLLPPIERVGAFDSKNEDRLKNPAGAEELSQSLVQSPARKSSSTTLTSTSTVLDPLTATAVTTTTTTVTTVVSAPAVFPPIWLHVARVQAAGLRAARNPKECALLYHAIVIRPFPYKGDNPGDMTSEKRPPAAHLAAKLIDLLGWDQDCRAAFRVLYAPPPAFPPELVHLAQKCISSFQPAPANSTISSSVDDSSVFSTRTSSLSTRLFIPRSTDLLKQALKWVTGCFEHPFLPSIAPYSLSAVRLCHPGIFFFPIFIPPLTDSRGSNSPQPPPLSPFATAVLARWGELESRAISGLAAETLLFCLGKPLAPFPRGTPVTLGAVDVTFESDSGGSQTALLPLWRPRRLLLNGGSVGVSKAPAAGWPTPDVYDSLGSGLFLKTARARLHYEEASPPASRGVRAGVDLDEVGANNPPAEKLASILKTWVARGSNILRVDARARNIDVYMASKD